jgi:hypothetical protein
MKSMRDPRDMWGALVDGLGYQCAAKLVNEKVEKGREFLDDARSRASERDRKRRIGALLDHDVPRSRTHARCRRSR